MLWKMRLEKISNKVVNDKQTVVVRKIEFSNTIAIVSSLLLFHYDVVFVKASILLIMRDEEDKNLLVKIICLFFNIFFLSILIRFLLNSKKSSDSNATIMHVLSIRYVEIFSIAFYLAH
jgi:hypothetical protein